VIQINDVKVDGNELKVVPVYGKNSDVMGVETLNKEGVK
jgi:hypothetical protein